MTYWTVKGASRLQHVNSKATENKRNLWVTAF